MSALANSFLVLKQRLWSFSRRQTMMNMAPTAPIKYNSIKSMIRFLYLMAICASEIFVLFDGDMFKGDPFFI